MDPLWSIRARYGSMICVRTGFDFPLADKFALA
jgi:hypothetical protein